MNIRMTMGLRNLRISVRSASDYWLLGLLYLHCATPTLFFSSSSGKA